MPKNTKTKEPLQKGTRRQKLHEDQNNVGDPHNKSEYKSLDGEEL